MHTYIRVRVYFLIRVNVSILKISLISAHFEVTRISWLFSGVRVFVCECGLVGMRSDWSNTLDVCINIKIWCCCFSILWSLLLLFSSWDFFFFYLHVNFAILFRERKWKWLFPFYGCRTWYFARNLRVNIADRTDVRSFAYLKIFNSIS